jgi:hypothetical protein
MKISTFSEMIQEYEVRPIDSDDLQERDKLLGTHKYAIIFEAEFLEFETLEQWIKANITEESLTFLFYGKLDYDYGFFELFVDNKSHFEKIETIIPTLYTTYPNGETLKTNGYKDFIYR